MHNNTVINLIFVFCRIPRTTRFACMSAQISRVVRWRCVMRIFQASGPTASRTALPAFRSPVERKSFSHHLLPSWCPMVIWGSAKYEPFCSKYSSVIPHTAGWDTSTLATVATSISLRWGLTSTGMTGELTTPRSSPSVGWETCRRTVGAASRWLHKEGTSRLWANRRE